MYLKDRLPASPIRPRPINLDAQLLDGGHWAVSPLTKFLLKLAETTFKFTNTNPILLPSTTTPSTSLACWNWNPFDIERKLKRNFNAHAISTIVSTGNWAAHDINKTNLVAMPKCDAIVQCEGGGWGGWVEAVPKAHFKLGFDLTWLYMVRLSDIFQLTPFKCNRVFGCGTQSNFYVYQLSIRNMPSIEFAFEPTYSLCKSIMVSGKRGVAWGVGGVLRMTQRLRIVLALRRARPLPKSSAKATRRFN